MALKEIYTRAQNALISEIKYQDVDRRVRSGLSLEDFLKIVGEAVRDQTEIKVYTGRKDLKRPIGFGDSDNIITDGEIRGVFTTKSGSERLKIKDVTYIASVREIKGKNEYIINTKNKALEIHKAIKKAGVQDKVKAKCFYWS